MVFDFMFVVMGFYVKEIFEMCFGVKYGMVINGEFSYDFGGGYFDFNLIWVCELMVIM